MTEKNHKIYCTHCGLELDASVQTCPDCGHPLHDKEHLFRDYLIRHTKDKLKGDAEDKLYEIIKNFLLSHLYGAVVTITLGAAVVSTAAAHPAPRIQKVPERPTAVRDVILESEAASAEIPSDTADTPEQTETPDPVEEPVQVPTYDFETQADVILANYTMWEKPIEYSMGESYYITDLDQDGLLEINCQATMGTGFFTSRVSFEVNETMDGLVPIAPEADNEPDVFYNLDLNDADMVDARVGYYDPEAKTYTFIMVDTWRAGAGNYGSAYVSMTMADNNYQFTLLGSYEHSANLDGTDEKETYKIGEQTYATEEEFHAAMLAGFEGCRKFTYSTTYLNSYEVTDLDAQIRQLIQGYYLTLE